MQKFIEEDIEMMFYKFYWTVAVKAFFALEINILSAVS